MSTQSLEQFQGALSQHAKFVHALLEEGYTLPIARQIANDRLGANIPQLVFIALTTEEDDYSVTEGIPTSEQPFDSLNLWLHSLEQSMKEEDDQKKANGLNPIASPEYTLPTIQPNMHQIVRVCRNPQEGFQIHLIRLFQYVQTIKGDELHIVDIVPMYGDTRDANHLRMVTQINVNRDATGPVTLSSDLPPDENARITQSTVDILKALTTSRQEILPVQSRRAS